MSTPAPINIALVLAIPTLHFYVAQAFGFQLSRIPPVIITSSKCFLLAYISWVVKAPVLEKVFQSIGLDELQVHSSMWSADNVHIFSMVATYCAILSAQKPWKDGYVMIMAFAVCAAVIVVILQYENHCESRMRIEKRLAEAKNPGGVLEKPTNAAVEQIAPVAAPDLEAKKVA